MKGAVLFVGAVALQGRLVEGVGARNIVVTCHDPRRGCAFIRVGRFDAVMVSPAIADMVAPFAEARGIDLVAADDDGVVDEVMALVEAAIRATREREIQRAHQNTIYTGLTYREFLELERTRTAHEYLTALLAAHGGSVTDAAAAGHIERESLHRLLRLHRISADDFRTGMGGASTPTEA